MMKLDTINAVAPYMPFARSLTKVLRSSKNAGTYATAIKDMKAPPKNCKSQPRSRDQGEGYEQLRWL